MAKLEVRSKDGKKVGSVDVPAAIANAEVAPHALHRAVVTEEANSRQGTSATKDRHDVRGGGRKPYRQKKTGRARQGSIRAPHYTHGGTAHELKPRDYSLKLNKKERRSAILGAIASKIQADALLVVDTISFAEAKTKNATGLLSALGVQNTRRILIVLPQYDETTYKCFRNLSNVVVRTAPTKNPSEEAKCAPFSARDVLVAHAVVMAQEALLKVEEVWSK